MNAPKPSLWQQIFTRNMLLCIFIGFSSGLPLYVLAQLVPAWLTAEKVDIKTIGFFTIVMFPYTWKFLIAPFLDRYYPNFLGRRRSWMFISQIALLSLLMLLGQFDPKTEMSIIIYVSFAIALFSALQDIVIDAYRREILSDEELGLGNAIHVNAYRVAGLIPGGVSLILADRMPWDTVFLFTAFFMLPGLFLSLFLGHEPKVKDSSRTQTIDQAIIMPFKEFFSRKGIKGGIGLILFIFLYKFGDSLATSLQTNFLLSMGFSNSDLGTVVKFNSFWAVVVSGMVGGVMMLRLGINRALWLFGAVQLFTILCFAWLASFDKFTQIGAFEYFALSFVMIAEYVGVGLGTAAFVAFMASETNRLYTATQLAMFTSLAAIPSKILGSFSGVIVSWIGYYHFFWFCFFVGIPGMICLIWVAPWKKNSPNN